MKKGWPERAFHRTDRFSRRVVAGISVFAVLLASGIASHAQIVADHATVEALERIPNDAIGSAAALRLLFRHASVGTTIDNALDCLQGSRTSPAVCATFPEYRYDRRRWVFEARANSGWYAKVDDFVTAVEADLGSYDVFAFKYCYLDGLDGLLEPCGSTLDPARVEAAWDYLRAHVDELEASHPDKTFVWWTIPLTQVGQECTEVLNARIRDHARTQGKVLFDIADIESHDETGALHTNAQGWEIAVRELCGEQKPDAQACHPSWDGSLRLAKAHWWLMARVAGWSDAGEGVAFVRGDANRDRIVDVSDAVAILLDLFLETAPPVDCRDALDVNDDGQVDISDPIFGLDFLFLGGATIPPPFPEEGPDPTPDAIECGA